MNLRNPLNMVVNEDESSLVIGLSTDIGSRLSRGALGCGLPLYFLADGLSGGAPPAPLVLFSLILFGFYLLVEFYRLSLRHVDGAIEVEIGPRPLSWLSTRGFDLQSVDDVREKAGGIELSRGGRWSRVWMTYPPLRLSDGTRPSASICDFVRSSSSKERAGLESAGRSSSEDGGEYVEPELSASSE